MLCCTHKQTNIQLLESAIDTTTLSETQKLTLKARLISLLKEYDTRAYTFSVAFNTFRITITVGSLIVPALLSVQYASTTDNQQTVGTEVYWIVWVISLMVTISNGILSLLKIDKKYFTLNTTYQHLLSEGWQFIHLSGVYSGSYTPTIAATHQNQFMFFCNKIEKIRMKHVEDEYYKTAEHTQSLQEVIVPPTPFRNRLPFENSDAQVNGRRNSGTGSEAEITTVRRNPQAQIRFAAPLNSIAEEGTNHE
jgi:hypothetical protein